MKLIRSVIALMLISLSSPYFLHPAARAAAGIDDEPTNAPEEGPGEAEAPVRPAVPGGIAAAVRAMAPQAVIRAPEHGWLSFIVRGEDIPPIPYTTDSQKLLRQAIERSALGAVEDQPHIYYINKAWADIVAKGTPVRRLPLYYVIEGDDDLSLHYCENQDKVHDAIKTSNLGLVPGQTQVFYVTRAQGAALEKAGFHYQLSYFYVVVDGDDPLNIWCCDNQAVVKDAIKDSVCRPVPGATPNVFFITRPWKTSLDDLGTRLLQLNIIFPGEDWLTRSWRCKDQRLVRQAIRESHLGRIPDGVTNTYYVAPEWKGQLEKGSPYANAGDFTSEWWHEKVTDESYRWKSLMRQRVLVEAIIDSGTTPRHPELLAREYFLSPTWCSRLVKEPGVYKFSVLYAAEKAKKDAEGSCCVQ